jgi:uncharacterized membrane protein YbhN (UPF0104 family)
MHPPHSGTQDSPDAGENSREWVIFAIRLVAGLVILVIASRLVDLDAIWEIIIRIDPLLFLVALLLSLAGTIVIPAVSARTVLKSVGIEHSLAGLVKINLAMRFYVLALPHAVTVGIRWYRYKRGLTKGWEVAAMLIFERAAQLLATAGMGFVFLVLAFPTLPAALRPLAPLSVLLALAALVLILVFVWPGARRMVEPLLDRLLQFMPRWASLRLGRLREAVADLHKLQFLEVLLVVTCAFGWHLCFVASGYAASEALGAGLDFSQIGWMRSAILLLMVLPVTVGGLGVREVGLAVLFEMQGAGYAAGMAFGLVLLTIQLLTGFTGFLLEWRNLFGLPSAGSRK